MCQKSAQIPLLVSADRHHAECRSFPFDFGFAIRRFEFVVSHGVFLNKWFRFHSPFWLIQRSATSHRVTGLDLHLAVEAEAFSMPEIAQEVKDGASVSSGLNTKEPPPSPESAMAIANSTRDYAKYLEVY